MILPMLEEAWISIISNKLRSFLTILGVVIGVCAVVLMVATGQAVQLEINKQLEGIGGNMMLVVPASSNKGGIHSGRGGMPTLTMQDMQAVKEVEDVVNVAPLVSSSYQVVAGSNNWNTTVYGTNTEYLDIHSFKIARGNMFSEKDVYSGSPFAVIGQTIVDKLFPYGEEPLGKDIRIKGVPFKIIGILQEKGADSRGNDQDDVILLPVKAFKNRLTSNAFPDRVAILFVTFDKTENMKIVERRIQTLLEVRHNISVNGDPDFEIVNLTEMVQKISMIGLVLTILLSSVASISLFVGSIGIMNMMLTSVTERTKEIGIRKAIGAPNRSILFQFLIESILISAIGSLFGMFLGIILSQIGGNIFSKTVPISLFTIIISVLAAIFVGIVSGIAPAIKATKLNPIDALRYG
ncbi:MAG TPA: ABC transporter permease [Rickettsiales bacterium]|nr:ABC transporter permease [Rickettsiales bacterium]